MGRVHCRGRATGGWGAQAKMGRTGRQEKGDRWWSEGRDDLGRGWGLGGRSEWGFGVGFKGVGGGRSGSMVAMVELVTADVTPSGRWWRGGGRRRGFWWAGAQRAPAGPLPRRRGVVIGLGGPADAVTRTTRKWRAFPSHFHAKPPLSESEGVQRVVGCPPASRLCSCWLLARGGGVRVLACLLARDGELARSCSLSCAHLLVRR